MMSENMRECLWFAASLVLAYWGVVFTTFVWEVICAVVKSAITNTLVP